MNSQVPTLQTPELLPTDQSSSPKMSAQKTVTIIINYLARTSSAVQIQHSSITRVNSNCLSARTKERKEIPENIREEISGSEAENNRRVATVTEITEILIILLSEVRCYNSQTSSDQEVQ